MKNHAYLVRVIAIAALVLSVHCRINRECGRLSYRKPISNKPDIIIAQYFEEAKPNKPNKTTTEEYEEYEDEEEPRRHFGICHFKFDRNNASLLVNYDWYMKNKLAYDSQARTLYAGFGSTIYKLQRDRNSATQLLSSPEIPFRPRGFVGAFTDTVAIAYDWVTQNFFVGSRVQINVGHLNDERATSILFHARQRKDRVRRSIWTTPEELEEKAAEMDMSAWESRDDMKLIVHPSRGYVFVKLNSQELFRMDQDGKNKVMFRNYENETSVRVRSMALDYYTDRLYVLETRQEGNKYVTQIYHLNLDGGDMVTLNVDNSHAHYVPVMAVDKDYVYFARSENHLHGNYSIFRAGKSDGAMDMDFEIRNTNSRRHSGTYKLDEIIVSVPQEGMKDHPCGNNRGGCPVHCVAVPGADMKLTKKCVNFH